MKLRIKGNSLRLRVSCSEFDRLLRGNSVEETIRFAPGPEARLTYALEVVADSSTITAHYTPQKIVVLLPKNQLQVWGEADQVGIYAWMDIGPEGPLDLTIEKDFACLDRDDNEDTFANPHATSGSDLFC